MKYIAIFVAAIFILMVVGAASSPSSPVTETYMDSLTTKVADDAVTQYDIASRNGTALDRCVQAGLVAAAWLQAKNETKYGQWKQVELADCKAAGVPR